MDFEKNISTTDMFCMLEILEKKWKLNEAFYQLIIDFKNACGIFRREVICNNCY